MKLNRLVLPIAFLGFVVLALSALPADAAPDGRTFTIFVGGGRSIQTWHGHATIESLHMEWAQPLRWKTQIALDVAPYSIQQPRSWFGNRYHDGQETARAIAAALILRRTFRTQSSLRPYVEIGSGPMVANRRVPAATSHFNFASQAGFGVMLMTGTDFGVFAGYRFWHVSNGGIAPRNPGLNVNGFVIGSRLVGR
jgi:lipid A 3-O-deacylase